jgi:hypothetical protein
MQYTLSTIPTAFASRICCPRSLSAGAVFSALLVLAAAAPTSAQAQTILQIRLVPPSPVAGVSALLAARFDPNDKGTGCNVRVDFGDGSPQADFAIREPKEVGLTVKHMYEKPGDYIVAVRPAAKGDLPACAGGAQSSLIEVKAPN